MIKNNIERSNYEVLGIKPTVSELEIKQAYRRLAKKFHPDVGGSQEKFIELKKARDELLCPKVPVFFGIQLWEDLVSEDDYNNNKHSKEFRRARSEEYKYYYKWEREVKNTPNTDEWKVMEELRNNSENWKKFVEARDYFEKCEKEKYKEFNWAKNKLKLMMGLNRSLQPKYTLKELDDIVGLDLLISHFKSVIDNTIDINKKILKPEEMIIKEIKIIDVFRDYHIPEHNEYNIKKTKKLAYNLMNQFHPKFINKFPMRIQIFLRNQIKSMVSKLQENLTKLNSEDNDEKWLQMVRNLD